MKSFKKFALTLLISILILTSCNINSQYKTSNDKETKIETSFSEESTKALSETNNESLLNVYFIDIGQGDSALLEYNNHYMLIDAGDNNKENFIVEYLNSKNIKTLDYVICTHPHADHIGGIDAVLSNFDIEQIYMSEASSTTKTFEDVIDEIINKNLKVKKPIVGEKITFDDLPIEIISPNQEYDKLNNNSIVLKLTYEDISFLFTGDAEEIAENDILNSDFDISANVLKVGHHGSDTSTSDEFLKAVNPQYAVISCGKDNQYGHPYEATLQKLKNNNIEILRTDENGTIIFSTDGENLKIITDTN